MPDASPISKHVQYGYTASEYEVSYKITPYAYWSKNGVLVLDYRAEPTGSWWNDHYNGIDPALILPWRYDHEKYGITQDNDDRFRTKEIVFIPKYPSPGDTVLIIARVHNYGLVDITDSVNVSFYLGDPDHFGRILYDKNTGDSVFHTCDVDGFPTGLESRGGAAAAQMIWSVPTDESITECQRIWALIDPLDEISEIHDNDEITNNKGWKILNVNTMNECYDPDEDSCVVSAYQCCEGMTMGDNCPDVYNPDQLDTDGDGIGDACEPVVIVCGDANGDLTIGIGDAVHLINYIFKGGPAPDPECVGDANGDDGISVSDAVHLINYIFKGGPAPVEPCCP